MPIYAYRCSSCGHAKDVLRKISDPPLSTCPACGADTFTKQVTAAGFQLKGSGWYVTDFKGGNGAGKAAPAVAAGGDSPVGDKPASDKPAADKAGGDKSGGGSTSASGASGGESPSSTASTSTST